MNREMARDDRGFRRDYDGFAQELRRVRSDVVDCLRLADIDQEVIDRSALVVSELASNAIQAAPGERFSVELVTAVDEIGITVRNAGDGTHLPARSDWGPTHPLALRGRGLSIVAALSDDVEVDVTDDQVIVIARIRYALQ